jgi:hypothetical protein
LRRGIGGQILSIVDPDATAVAPRLAARGAGVTNDGRVDRCLMQYYRSSDKMPEEMLSRQPFETGDVRQPSDLLALIVVIAVGFFIRSCQGRDQSVWCNRWTAADRRQAR